MSATSGIAASQDLIQQFSSAIESQLIRFLKVSIANEALICDQAIPAKGAFLEDLKDLQSDGILDDNAPAYVLTRLDDPSTEWLAIFYVPETAKVRDKMLYASTRQTLLRTLGSQTFTDSLFATSKGDLTPQAYLDHRKHLSAPKPLSRREQELEDIKAAERVSTGGVGADYRGSAVRQSPVGQTVDVQWSGEVEAAIQALVEGEGNCLVILKYDTSSSTETLGLDLIDTNITADKIGEELPAKDPCYAFFAWPHEGTRDIVYIYSCPSTSSIKHRMLYSCGSSSIYNSVKVLATGSSSTTNTTMNPRKIETSDPAEVNEAFLISHLTPDGESDSTPGGGSQAPAGEKKMFARPKGPGRKR